MSLLTYYWFYKKEIELGLSEVIAQIEIGLSEVIAQDEWAWVQSITGGYTMCDTYD